MEIIMKQNFKIGDIFRYTIDNSLWVIYKQEGIKFNFVFPMNSFTKKKYPKIYSKILKNWTFSRHMYNCEKI